MNENIPQQICLFRIKNNEKRVELKFQNHSFLKTFNYLKSGDIEPFFGNIYVNKCMD